MLDLWGSATMRTGGDDLAQAFAFLGCRPAWDLSSNRVTGFEILPLAMLGRPRVDVTLRISGLFRDVFPSQIALFGAAVRAVAELDESVDDNPLAASRARLARVFGAAPGAYGVGLGRRISEGEWAERADLRRPILPRRATPMTARATAPAAAAFRARVAGADAFVHAQDLPGQDALDADAFSEHEGGFAAAAATSAPSQRSTISIRAHPRRRKSVRSSRRLRARCAAARQIRAGSPARCATAIGARPNRRSRSTISRLRGADRRGTQRQFDLMFDATLGNEPCAAFWCGPI